MRLVPRFDGDMGSNARVILFGSPFDLPIPPPKPEAAEAAGSQCKAPEASVESVPPPTQQSGGGS